MFFKNILSINFDDEDNVFVMKLVIVVKSVTPATPFFGY